MLKINEWCYRLLFAGPTTEASRICPAFHNRGLNREVLNQPRVWYHWTWLWTHAWTNQQQTQSPWPALQLEWNSTHTLEIKQINPIKPQRLMAAGSSEGYLYSYKRKYTNHGTLKPTENASIFFFLLLLFFFLFLAFTMLAQLCGPEAKENEICTTLFTKYDENGTSNFLTLIAHGLTSNRLLQ